MKFKKLIVAFEGLVKNKKEEKLRLVELVKKVAEVVTEDNKTFITLTAKTLNKYKLK